jgi:hypothetical protein
MASSFFSATRPIYEHLSRGRHGLKGEIVDLRADIEEAFSALDAGLALPIAVDDGLIATAYKETLPAGAAFPTTGTWWVSAAKLRKLIELTVTRDSSQRPVTEVWRIYGPTGLVSQTVTDTIVYVGAFEFSRTRVVT